MLHPQHGQSRASALAAQSRSKEAVRAQNQIELGRGFPQHFVLPWCFGRIELELAGGCVRFDVFTKDIA